MLSINLGRSVLEKNCALSTSRPRAQKATKCFSRSQQDMIKKGNSKKSKTSFTSLAAAWRIGPKHSGLNVIEFNEWLASWSSFQINSPFSTKSVIVVVSGSDKSENTEFYFRDFVNCLIISLFCSKNSVNSDEKSLPQGETTLSLIARLT